MAARNVKSPAVYESMDKLPSNTLKRHPKMDLNKNDLLRLLGYLEGELQARDVSIAALKAEKAKQLLYQAKYGRFGLGDPFHALQRDSDSHKDNSFDEAAVKAMYDNQLLQLENLIETQRKAQQRMREQLAAVEKRYHKVCAELEDEQRKHAQDTAQGDDVTYLLEKERERLKQELDFEKTQQKKLEKEVKKLTSSLEEERAMSAKHKQVAIFLIKERKKMVERVLALQQRSTAMENLLRNDKAKMDDMAEGLILESQKSLQMEAALEKQLSEFDVERQQLRHKLGREEARNEDLAAEVDSLRQRVERLMQHAGPELQALAAEQGFTPRGHAPPPVRTPGPAGPMATGPRFTPVRHPTNMQAHARTMASSTSPPPPGARGTPPEVRKLPIVHVRDSPERDGTPGAHPQTNPAATPSPSDPSGVKRVIRQFGGQPGVGVAAGSLPQGARSPVTVETVERPHPHPSPASPAAHAHPHAHPHAAANDKPADLSNSRVNVIGAGGGGSVFTSPSGNTTVFTTPSGTRISLNVGPAGSSAAASATAAAAAAAPGSTTMIRKVGPAGLGRGVPPPVPPNKPQVYLPQQQHQQPPGAPSTQQPRKDNMCLESDPPGSHEESPPASNLDFLGPEMTDLQRLLVSMATGAGEGSPPRVVSASMPSSSVSSTSPSSSSSSSMSSPPTVKDASPVSDSDASSVTSAASSSSTPPPPPLLHKLVIAGDVTALAEYLANHSQGSGSNSIVNQPMGNERMTAMHIAAGSGQAEVLRLLLTVGGSANVAIQNKHTPLHAAAAEGHLDCLQLLLTGDGDVQLADQSGWTALHWAASNGHTDCCRCLLNQRSRIDAMNNASWTPLHLAIHSGHADCLKALLTHRATTTNHGSGRPSNNQSRESLVDDVINLVDRDGWTVAHLAAIRPSKDCLETMCQHTMLDLDRTDKWNRSVMEIASQECRAFLLSLGKTTKRLCSVRVDLPKDSLNNKPIGGDTFCLIGTVTVVLETTWSELEEHLGNLVLNHVTELGVGLRTKRTAKADQDSPESPSAFQLGVSLHSIKYYSIGLYHWSPGTPYDRTPFDLLVAMETSNITVVLFGNDDNCQDALAYVSLLPVSVIQNYLRLIEQYKNLMFYGPVGCGKTFMAKNLALCIQSRERHSGSVSDIHLVVLYATFSRTELINLLIEKGCLLASTEPVPVNKSPIIILDDLGKVSVTSLFKDLLTAVENRGPTHMVHVQTDPDGEPESYYMHPQCYILGTIDKVRSTGLELSIQQRFRWVHFRCDQEPMRHLLQRHLWRRLVHHHGGHLPPGEDAVYRAVEWVLCVWQRLNEGLAKLALLDLYFGPSNFISCPIEANKPKALLRWLSLLWNHVIAPAVSEAVIKGSGAETGPQGHQKVASTALYILMQRAVVTGCPLSGQEKDRYLSSFLGSNDLDIKMRGDKREGGEGSPAGSPVRRPPYYYSDSSASSASESEDEDSGGHRTTPMKVKKPQAVIAPRAVSGSRDPKAARATSLDPPTKASTVNANGADDYGNSYFAVAGVPTSPGPPRVLPPRNLSEASSIVSATLAKRLEFSQQAAAASGGPQGLAKYGVPVIVTQPLSITGSPAVTSVGQHARTGSAPAAPGAFMSRSFDGELPGDRGENDVMPTADLRRALSPQPVAARPWSPGPDPRRSISPGPELMRADFGRRSLNYGRVYKPVVPEPLSHQLNSATARLAASKPPSMVGGAPKGPPGAKFGTPTVTVVNPTRLAPFSTNTATS